MKVIQYQIKRNSNIFLGGDRHVGNAARSQDAVDHFKNALNSKYDGCANNYYVDHGDNLEAISSDDRRFEFSTHKTLPFDELDFAIEEYRNIAFKTICILYGNHEYKWNRFGDLTAKLVKYTNEKYGSNIEYGTNSCVIVYRDENNKFLFRHFAWHPMSGRLNYAAKDPDQKLGNILAGLKQRFRDRWGNALLMSCGHYHQLIVNKPKEQLLHMEQGGKISKEYATARKVDGYIHPDFRWYVCTGSFLTFYVDGLSTYVERSGSIQPADTGYAIAKVRDGRLVDIDRIKLV